MRTYLTLLVIIVLSVFTHNSFAQKNLEISFTARYYGEPVGLDSILIKNITRGCDTTLYAPDTVLVLDYAVGLVENILDKPSFSITQNHPNPVTQGFTSFEVQMDKAGHLTLQVVNVNGIHDVILSKHLETGKHIFEYFPARKGMYLLIASNGEQMQNIKIINYSEQTFPVSKLVYQSIEFEPSQSLKSKSISSHFEYTWADTLWYIGYAETPENIQGSDVIDGSPDVNSLVRFDIIEGMPCKGTEAVKHGGQLYATVQIDNECWLKENLNIGTMIHGDSTMTDNDIIEKYCYDNDPANCLEYGGLYQWNELMQYTEGDGAQGICPHGWHITSIDEWNNLTAIHPGFTVKEHGTTHWAEGNNATNSTGLTILPGGYKWWSNGNYEQLTTYAAFYTSTKLPSPPSWGVWFKGFFYNSSGSEYGNAYETHGDAVRCIKDVD
jgi:uncharacterized protein (TIGR02145 family)